MLRALPVIVSTALPSPTTVVPFLSWTLITGLPLEMALMLAEFVLVPVYPVTVAKAVLLLVHTIES